MSVAALSTIIATTVYADEAASCRAGATRMEKVELYFGARPGDAEPWRRFLAQVVTPRFPDGLTQFDGAGQWRGTHGLIHERSRILVIYDKRDAGGDARIETIRAFYKARFAQRSLLRVDAVACVSF